MGGLSMSFFTQMRDDLVRGIGTSGLATSHEEQNRGYEKRSNCEHHQVHFFELQVHENSADQQDLGQRGRYQQYGLDSLGHMNVADHQRERCHQQQPAPG